ncbi:hypothetical protein FRUB_01270 [Fimbriiglobus ruber]|uniref:Uncharacterized protein n=1 Tax=Fimbriiglobus ruber TaxID=1908690 RepID=A0A225E1Z7_9BACT|nr:hypothetical protein FRUB_01270 [Fimbriiglobus ruber]
MTGATIDKISVTLEPPPAPNAWQYWLQSSPYGQQLLALLQVVSAAASTSRRVFRGKPVPVRERLVMEVNAATPRRSRRWPRD